MKGQEMRTQVLARSSIAGLGLAVVAGCGFFDSGNRTWSEEVQLDDGRVITIDRHVEFDASNALGGGAYSATESKSTLSFQGDLAALPAWDVPLMPLVLYQDAETMEWAIVATTTTCLVWSSRGKPVPPYWEFRLRGVVWEQVALSPTSFGRNTNLLFEYTQKLSARQFTVPAKADLVPLEAARKYVVVLRDATTNCM
jgi:hypothetical protein